jgi:hypothetical protein
MGGDTVEDGMLNVYLLTIPWHGRMLQTARTLRCGRTLILRAFAWAACPQGVYHHAGQLGKGISHNPEKG